MSLPTEVARPSASAQPAEGGIRPSLVRSLLRQPLAVAALMYVTALALGAVFAPVLAPFDPTATDLTHVLSTPSHAHLLGTDSLGRDVLSRVIYAGRLSLLGVVEAVCTALLLGVAAGLLAGFLGGWVDRAISWVIDVMFAIPVIVTLLVIISVVGNNQTVAMVSLGVLSAPHLARVIRGATLAVRNELYVAAARVAGLSAWRIMVGQVAPRVAGPVIVQASLQAGIALLVETGLGFLGFGAKPPTPTWGGMVAEASQVISQQSWLLVPSGVVTGLAILAFGLIGDGVRDATAGSKQRRVVRVEPRRVRRRPPRDASAVRGMASAAERESSRREVEDPNAQGSAQPVPLLAMRGLTVRLSRTVVEGASLNIWPGETVGLVGESGCGKSITARAILGLLPPAGEVASGQILFGDTDLVSLSRKGWRSVRGSKIALVSQEPVGSLDPVFTIGYQVGELVRRHQQLGRRRAVRERTLDLLEAVRLSDPAAIARRYPHELSGGMAQRVGIAMALAGNPSLLIADEPTTALDVTVQSEILHLLRTLQHERNMAILLISHDWGVIANVCHRAYVMYAGHVVESAPVTSLFDEPRHPYTAGLLDCSPRNAQPRTTLRAIQGAVPDPADWPAGCHFHPRCPIGTPDCAAGPIPLLEVSPEHQSRCIHHHNVTRAVANGRASRPA